MDSSADANHARIVRSVRSEFWKFRRMQNSCENFEAVDNARPGTRKVCTGVYDMNLAGLRGGDAIKTGKSPEQFVIAARSINVIPAKRKHDNFWTRIQHLLPIDLSRRLMLAA